MNQLPWLVSLVERNPIGEFQATAKSMTEMSFSNELVQHEQVVQCLTARCARLLGGTAMPIELDWSLLRLVQPQLRRVEVSSLVSAQPLISLAAGRPGHRARSGLELCHLPIAGGNIDVVTVTLPYQFNTDPFWCVRAEDYRKFYRHVRPANQSDVAPSSPATEIAKPQKVR